MQLQTRFGSPAIASTLLPVLGSNTAMVQAQPRPSRRRSCPAPGAQQTQPSEAQQVGKQ